MTIQQKLLPLIENTDYAIQNGELTPLPKVRVVEQIIPHAEIPAVVGQEAHGIIPATFDASGNELTPMIPAQEFIAAVAAIPAYDEVILVNETYYEVLPTLDEVKLSCIADVAIAVSEYLADKTELRDIENDSLNIVNNNIYSWGFSNIPQPSISELYDANLAAIAKNSQEAINAEAKKYLADTDYKILKSIESGIPVAEEITLARAAARARIV